MSPSDECILSPGECKSSTRTCLPGKRIPKVHLGLRAREHAHGWCRAIIERVPPRRAYHVPKSGHPKGSTHLCMRGHPGKHAQVHALPRLRVPEEARALGCACACPHLAPSKHANALSERALWAVRALCSACRVCCNNPNDLLQPPTIRSLITERSYDDYVPKNGYKKPYLMEKKKRKRYRLRSRDRAGKNQRTLQSSSFSSSLSMGLQNQWASGSLTENTNDLPPLPKIQQN